MYLLVDHGIQGWLPTMLESRGFSAHLSGRTTGLFVVTSVIGILTIPTVADRLSARRPALISCGSIVFVGAIGLALGVLGPLLFAGVVVVFAGESLRRMHG